MMRLTQHMAWLLAVMAGGYAWGVVSHLNMLRESVEDLPPQAVAEPGTHFLHADGMSTAYREMGQGEPAIILLHCFAGRMETWRALQPMLAMRHRTVAFDLWGLGASSRPPQLQPDDWNRQVFMVMDQLGIESAILVGHSMGGRVALSCASSRPDRVRGIVLMGADGNRLPKTYPALWALAQSRFTSLVQHYLTYHPEWIDRLMRGAYPPDYPITRSMIRLYQHPLRVRGTMQALLHLACTYHGKNLAQLSRQLSRLQCPALLIWGERDRITPLPYAEHLLSVLPDADLIVLPGVHHLPHEECPYAVARHIRRFLRNKTC